MAITIYTTADFDYVNKTVNFSVQSTGYNDFGGQIVKLISPKGHIVSTGFIADSTEVSPRSNYENVTISSTSASMVQTFSSQGLHVERFQDNNPSGVWFSEPYSIWRPSSSIGTEAATGVETGTIPKGLIVSQQDTAYVGTPILITRGEMVLYQ